MALRRGFKNEANEIAREVRKELGLRPVDRLDPWRLAGHLDIPVVPLSALEDTAPDGVRHFTAVEPGAFSAVTVFRGPTRLIVHNDSHTQGRQASNIAHELGHGLLLHPPAPALGDGGCREWDQILEEEANWLAGALLVSEEAAVLVVRRSLSLEEAATAYGVSEAMMRFRINVTGARKRVARAQVRWR
jgi:Zn-dependent peptidase ImmA (M78 family)